ncbi:hypothetical protein [Engelhardtia mirabilis]|uniref:hypothetical protein n=1 Tax=Engelhardtia mirabilis TaxID=2528011 RepID=UPI0011A5755D
MSEVVRRALAGEPQRIERRDDAVVVLSAAEFDRLTGARPDFVEFLMSWPDISDLDLSRHSGPGRATDPLEALGLDDQERRS